MTGRNAVVVPYEAQRPSIQRCGSFARPAGGARPAGATCRCPASPTTKTTWPVARGGALEGARAAARARARGRRSGVCVPAAAGGVGAGARRAERPRGASSRSGLADAQLARRGARTSASTRRADRRRDAASRPPRRGRAAARASANVSPTASRRAGRVGGVRVDAHRADVDRLPQLGPRLARGSLGDQPLDRERGLHGALRRAARARAGCRRPPSGATGVRVTKTPPKPATRSSIVRCQRRAAVHGSCAPSRLGKHEVDRQHGDRLLLPASAPAASAARRRRPRGRARGVRRVAGALRQLVERRALDAEAPHAIAERVAAEAEEARGARRRCRRRARARRGCAPPRRRRVGAPAGLRSGAGSRPAARAARASRSSVVAVDVASRARGASRAPSGARARARCPASRSARSQARAPSSSRFGASAVRRGVRARGSARRAQRRRRRASRSGGSSRMTTRQAMVEVGAEAAGADQLARGPAASRRSSLTSTRCGATAPRRRTRLLLDRLQQLALERRAAARRPRRGRGVPPDGRLEEARLGALRIGEGAGLEAEQLGLEHGLGNGGAVDVDERAAPPGRRSRGSRARPVPCRCRSRPGAGRSGRAGCRAVSKAARRPICVAQRRDRRARRRGSESVGWMPLVGHGHSWP